MTSLLADRSRALGQHRRQPSRRWHLRQLAGGLVAVALVGAGCATLVSFPSSLAGAPERPNGSDGAATSVLRATGPDLLPSGNPGLSASLTASANLVRLNQSVIFTARLPDAGPWLVNQARLEIARFAAGVDHPEREWQPLTARPINSPLGSAAGTAIESFTFDKRGLYQARMVLQISAADADPSAIPVGADLQTVTTNEVEIQVVGDQVLALTFDDGPGKNHTLEVLEALHQGAAKATFFLVCSRLESKANRAVARQTLAQGHQIGSHRWDHEYASTLMGQDEFTDQLDKCDDIFNRSFGFEPTVFRFPWGYGKADQIAEVKARGMDIYGWDYATGDGTTHEEQSSFLTDLIANKVITNAKSGDVILLHDAPNHANTAAAIPLILADFTARGFDFVTVNGLTQLGYSHREDFDPSAY